MGRNLIGGKNYKKTKHASEKTPYQVREDDQLWGRIFRVLGGRNTLVYCNDNEIRLCHIRGAIRKDNWISVGDIVLISIRDFKTEEEKDNTIIKKDKYEKGDIIYKYDRDYYSKLRKEKDMNPKLFLNLETATDDVLKHVKQNKLMPNQNDEGFDFDGGDADVADGEDSEDDEDGEDVDIDAI
jgi:initiation factor 1A